MSSGITATDTGFVVHKPTWHGLYDVLKKHPKTPKEAARKAGILWQVEQHDTVSVQQLTKALEAIKTGGGLTVKDVRMLAQEYAVANTKLNVRSDTQDVLGVVTDEYGPLQNLTMLEFAAALLGETEYAAGGSLFGGKQVFALLLIPDFIEIGGDKVAQYLYLRSRHDGNAALWAWWTGVRVECANTDRMAIAEAGGPNSPDIFKVRHIGDPSDVVAKARKALKMSVDYSKQFAKVGNRMASQKMTERKLNAVLAELYPGGVSDASVKVAEKRRDAVMAIFRGEGAHAKTQGNAPGTKWCAWNAVTEYDQHYRNPRTKDEALAGERRFLRSIEDTGNVQTRSFELVMAS
jgi:phage/plasmid-like protein (TIGR03299 family)